MHSVSAWCSDSLLSTSQSEQVQELLLVYLQSGLDHYGKTGLCYHWHIREAYSLDQCQLPYRWHSTRITKAPKYFFEGHHKL